MIPLSTSVRRFIATPTFDSSMVALLLFWASPTAKLLYCVSVLEKYWTLVTLLHDWVKQYLLYDIMVAKHSSQLT